MRFPRPSRIVTAVLLVTVLSYLPYVAFEECPSWLHEALSQESQHLIMQSDRDGSYETYMMNADGTDAIALRPDSMEEAASDGNTATMTVSLMSPDGLHAALQDEGLWLADRNLTKQQLLVDPPARVTGYSWSTDGRFLAYADGSLEVMDVERQQTRSLVAADIVGVIGVPQWSADGKYIAFDRFYSWGRDDREAGYQPLEIYVLDVSTFTPCLISTNPHYNDQNVNWLPEASQQ